MFRTAEPRGFDIRRDANFVDIRAVRREVAGDSEFDSGFGVGEFKNALDGCFSERFLPHDESASVVLDGPGDDFGGTRAAAVNEDNQWERVVPRGPFGDEVLALVNALAVDDELSFLEKIAGNGNGSI